MNFERGVHAQIQYICLKLLIGKRREYNLETHLFLQLVKKFVINKICFIEILKSKNISDEILKAIVDIYAQTKILM